MQRPFILLELFIALALLSLSIIPIASYPLKIYKKELDCLVEIQLEKTADLAFRDLLLDLPSYINTETFEPYSDIPEKSYTITLGTQYKWIYLAIWELEWTMAGDKAFLQASLKLLPQDLKAPKPNPFYYEYFVAKKNLPSHVKVHEDNKTVSPLHTDGEKAP